MKKYHSKEQIIGLKLLKRHNSINLKTGAQILEYSPPVQTNFPGEGNQRDGESCMPLLGTYYIHTFIHDITKILFLPKYLPLLFLSIFEILASPHIYLLHCFTLSLKNVELYAKNMGKKIKENNTWAGEKFQIPLNYIHPFSKTGCN